MMTQGGFWLVEKGKVPRLEGWVIQDLERSAEK